MIPSATPRGATSAWGDSPRRSTPRTVRSSPRPRSRSDSGGIAKASGRSRGANAGARDGWHPHLPRRYCVGDVGGERGDRASDCQPNRQGDFSRWLADVTADLGFVTSPDLPDAGTYREEAAKEWLTAWVESFVGHRIEGSDFIDAGDKVFYEILQRGRPLGSRVAVEGR